MLKKYFTKLFFGQDLFISKGGFKADKESANLNSVILQLSPFFPDETNDYDEWTIDLLAKKEKLERESKQ